MIYWKVFSRCQPGVSSAVFCIHHSLLQNNVVHWTDLPSNTSGRCMSCSTSTGKSTSVLSATNPTALDPCWDSTCRYRNCKLRKAWVQEQNGRLLDANFCRTRPASKRKSRRVHFLTAAVCFFSQKHRIDKKVFPCKECPSVLGSKQALLVSYQHFYFLSFEIVSTNHPSVTSWHEEEWPEKATVVISCFLANFKTSWMVCRSTCGSTEERSRFSANTVDARSLSCADWPRTRELTPGKRPTSVINATSTSIFGHKEATYGVSVVLSSWFSPRIPQPRPTSGRGRLCYQWASAQTSALVYCHSWSRDISLRDITAWFFVDPPPP